MRTLPSPILTTQDIARFWSHVQVTDECWEWTAYKRPSGYGVFTYRFPGGIRRKVLVAHRVAFLIAYGIWADDFVCHHCDNPSCVRPDHLFEGTPADNMIDKMNKGRATRVGPYNPATGIRNGKHTHPEKTVRGSRHYMAKVTEQDVVLMRQLYVTWRSGTRSNLMELANRFGISKANAHKIITGKLWTHVPGARTQLRTKQ
jgi:hypothetical protein